MLIKSCFGRNCINIDVIMVRWMRTERIKMAFYLRMSKKLRKDRVFIGVEKWR